MIAAVAHTNQPLVSICVPVYGVEKYIEKCARSLFAQTYANIEYVFVNDATPDSSMDILRRVAAEYPNRVGQIRYIENDSNHGLAYTRRRSIEEATGEYVCCVDSDDWVETTYVELLVNEAICNDVDMVVSPILEHQNMRTNILQDVFRYDSMFENCMKDLVSHLCGKLFKRSMFTLHNCYAPEGLNYLEDRLTLLQVSYYVQSFGIINMPCYHYVRRESSITSSKTSWHFKCLIIFWERVEQFLDEKNELGQWQSCIQTQKAMDKFNLLHQCPDIETRKRYADLYGNQELRYIGKLSPSVCIVAVLIHFHWWKLLSLFQHYIDFRNNCC